MLIDERERTLWHFRQELRLQSDIALRAFEGLSREFEQVDDTLGMRVFSAIQSILSAAAAISRILFSAKSPERAAALRTVLRIDDDSVLRSRQMRNHFEHFDERLDEWLPKTADGSVIDMVGSSERVNAAHLPRYTLRMFNVTTFEVTFADETLDLRSLVADIRSLRASLASK